MMDLMPWMIDARVLLPWGGHKSLVDTQKKERSDARVR